MTATNGAASSSPPSLRGLRILVIDPSEATRHATRDFLQKQGAIALDAPDAESALDFMQKASKVGKNFHIVIFDLKLSKMSGVEMAQAIRNDPAFKGTILMAVTSSKDREDIMACARYNIASYLLKPLPEAKLLAAIEDILNNLRKAKAGTQSNSRTPASPSTSSSPPGLSYAQVEELRQLIANRIDEWSSTGEASMLKLILDYLAAHCPPRS